MKLRNKKTGEIGYTSIIQSKSIFVMDENAIQLGDYDSLAELNKEWEDYNESKKFCYINIDGMVIEDNLARGWSDEMLKDMKAIGDYFETKKEAVKVAEKIKAWKRLKDEGFRFNCWKNDEDRCLGDFIIYAEIKHLDNIKDDLELLFGGDE